MIRKIIRNELVRGSLVLFITFNIFNLLNFIFQFSMARFLGPAEYGVFAVLMSLLYFMAIPSDSIQTVVSKYTSKFKVSNEPGKVKYLMSRALQKGFLASILVFIVLIPFFAVFGYFLSISFPLILLTGTMLFSFFLIPVTRGVMQGMKKFNALGMNMIVDSSLKVIVAIALVFMGWRVYGAVLSIIFGSVVAFAISFMPIKEVVKSDKEKANLQGIYSYSSPVIFTLLAILLMQSIDIILAKRFFPAEVAGQYAVANLIGKMIFFGTLAISKTMFPLTSEKFEDGYKTSKIFYRSLTMVLALCAGSLLILGLFPDLIVGILFGEQYLAITNIVLPMGVAFSFISLANLVLLYGLSVNRKIHAHYMAIFVVIQIALLWFFRSSLESFAMAMLISGGLLFLGSLLIVKRKS